MVEGTYWSSKCLIGGPRNVLKVRVAVLVGKGLIGYAAGRLGIFCPQYRNWQSLMWNEALYGSGGLDVYLGAMIL